MKNLIVAFIFAIGLMISLPLTSSGSESPPGQVSFVIEQPAIAPAVAFVQEAPFVVVYNLLAPVSVLEMEKGGESIEYSLTATEPFTMLTNLDFRICYTTDVNYRNQNYKLFLRNKDWVSQIRIRADSRLR